MIYYVDEFICMCVFDFVSFVYFYLVLCMLATVKHILLYLFHSVAAK